MMTDVQRGRQLVKWSTLAGGASALTASMLDQVERLPLIAWTVGGVIAGGLFGLMVALAADYFDGIEAERQENVARHIAHMEQRHADTKRRAA